MESSVTVARVAGGADAGRVLTGGGGRRWARGGSALSLTTRSLAARLTRTETGLP